MHDVFKWLMVLFLLFSPGIWATEVALVTALRGEVGINNGSGVKTPLQAFIKLHDGDTLQLGDASRLQIVYFQGARQETWLGPGNIEIGATESKTAAAISQPQTQQLSLQLVKQLSKTPTIDSRGRIAAFRTRSIAPSDNLEQALRTYQEMRAKTEANDRNPELYLLSVYFEFKEYGQILNLLTQLDRSYPGDLEIRILKSLYVKAINNAKMAAKLQTYRAN